MINQAMNILTKSMPAAMTYKMLTKVDPRLKTFMFTASSAGYGINQILDYLRDTLDTTDEQQEISQLQQKRQTTGLTTDEQKLMRQQRGQEAQKSIGKNILSTAGGAGAAKLVSNFFPQTTEEEEGTPAPKRLKAEQSDAENWEELKSYLIGLVNHRGWEISQAVNQAKTIQRYKKIIKDFEKQSNMKFADAALQTIPELGQMQGQQAQPTVAPQMQQPGPAAAPQMQQPQAAPVSPVQAPQMQPQAPQAAQPSTGDDILMQAIQRLQGLL